MSGELPITNVRLADGRHVDISIAGSRIAPIGHTRFRT